MQGAPSITESRMEVWKGNQLRRPSRLMRLMPVPVAPRPENDLPSQGNEPAPEKRRSERLRAPRSRPRMASMRPLGCPSSASSPGGTVPAA